MRHRLQVEKPVGPGRGCCEPDEGNEGRHEKVDLRVVFLLVRVEAGVEEVEGEAAREEENTTLPLLSLAFILPGGGVEPHHHSGEHKKLGIGGEISGKGKCFIFPSVRWTTDGTFVLLFCLVVQPEESLAFYKTFPSLILPGHGLPEGIGGGGSEMNRLCYVGVGITNNLEAKLERVVTTSSEGEQCNEPLDQSQQTSGLLQRLGVKWHFYG